MKSNRWKLFGIFTAVVVFALLAVLYDSGRMQALDNLMKERLGGNSFLGAFTFIGDPSTIVGVSGAVMVLLLIMKRPIEASFILLSIGAGYMVNEGLKAVFGRERPVMPDQLESYSFPSGHAQMGLLFIGTLTILAVRHLRSRGLKIITVVTAAGLIIATGLSRIALGRHYATDVFAGWSMGVAWLLLLMVLFSVRERGSQPTQQRKP